MKAHGIHDKATSVHENAVPSRRKAETGRSGPNKRTKLNHCSETTGTAANDDEGLTKAKSEARSNVIKNEPDQDGELSVTSSGRQYQPIGLEDAGRVDGGSIFNGFSPGRCR